jgi:hypothetical protein
VGTTVASVQGFLRTVVQIKAAVPLGEETTARMFPLVSPSPTGGENSDLSEQFEKG